jgi:hypothetical protein
MSSIALWASNSAAEIDPSKFGAELQFIRDLLAKWSDGLMESTIADHVGIKFKDFDKRNARRLLSVLWQRNEVYFSDRDQVWVPRE